MSDTQASRSDFALGLDIPADSERSHGTDASADELIGMTQQQAVSYIDALSMAERIEVLFGIEPFDYQRDLIAHVDATPVSKVAVQPGRQVGKTLIGAAIVADDAIRGKDEDTMIAAPFQETADELMREATQLLETAETRLEPLDITLGVETKNKREWIFEHGGRLLSRTLGIDGVGQRGKNPKTVIVDEAAFVPDSVYGDVIEPFFLTHDTYTFILTSTPSGDGGYYYERVELEDDWYSPFWPSALSPLVDPDWLAKKRNEKDRRTFRQEYLGQFVSSSDRFFDPEIIDEQMHSDIEATHIETLGADIARAGDDRTVIIGMGTDGTAEVMTSDASMSLSEATGRLTQLVDAHSIRQIAVDATGLGAGVVEMLEDSVGRRLVSGIKFTLDKKQSLFNELKNDLETGDIKMQYHGQLLRELRNLEYSLTARGKTKIHHPDGGHDDHCDALALAAHARRGGATDSNHATTADDVVVL